MWSAEACIQPAANSRYLPLGCCECSPAACTAPFGALFRRGILHVIKVIVGHPAAAALLRRLRTVLLHKTGPIRTQHLVGALHDAPRHVVEQAKQISWIASAVDTCVALMHVRVKRAMLFLDALSDLGAPHHRSSPGTTTGLSTAVRLACVHRYVHDQLRGMIMMM